MNWRNSESPRKSQDSWKTDKLAREIATQHGGGDVLPFYSPQRHRSYFLRGRLGDFWIKFEAISSPVAGLAIEAAILPEAFSLGIAPEPIDTGVVSSVPFLVTRHVAGRSAIGLLHDDRFWRALAEPLAAMDSLRDHAPLPNYGAHTDSEFGSLSDPYHCLVRICAEIGIHRDLPALGTLDLGDPGVVHGSLDPRNMVLTSRGTLVLLDWEAARLGRPSFDLTSFLYHSHAMPLIDGTPGGLNAVRAFSLLRRVNRARAEHLPSKAIEELLNRGLSELTR